MIQQQTKNKEMTCQNPICNNKTNSNHTKYCKKCSIRRAAKNNGYVLDEEKEIEIEDNQVGYILSYNRETGKYE